LDGFVGNVRYGNYRKTLNCVRAHALRHSITQSLRHSNHLPPCIEQMTAHIARNTFIPPESE